VFRASSAHLQEDIVVHVQHTVLSLSMRVPGGLSVHSLSSYSSWWPVGTQLEFLLKLYTDRPPGTLIESDSTVCCNCTTVSSWRWALEARNM